MKPRIVDAKGMMCPKPLVMTKTALSEMKDGDECVVLIDNETSKENVERFLRDNHLNFSSEKRANVFSIHVKKGAGSLSRTDAENYCDTGPAKHAHVVCFRSDKMGVGPDDLGALLVQAFINTIKDTPIPSALVFYNSSVHLTSRDSRVLESLKDLERRGVKILVCGTCVDYFKMKDSIGAGTISNMFTIMETLAHASHVVYP